MKLVFAILAFDVTVFAFDADAAACTAAQEDLATTTNDLERVTMRQHCELACANVDEEACNSDVVEKHVKLKACSAAKDDLDAVRPRFGSAEKYAKQTVCEKACAEVEEVTCGCLVNGVSLVLLVIFAIFNILDL